MVSQEPHKLLVERLSLVRFQHEALAECLEELHFIPGNVLQILVGHYGPVV